MEIQKLTMRHGLSKANDKSSPAFGKPNAPLMVRGWYDSFSAGDILENGHGVLPEQTPVAVSTMTRAEQTALGAGFLPENITSYKVLDEVDHRLALPVLRSMLDNNIFPERSLVAAVELLDNPPEEPVYVLHGLIGAAAVYMAGGPVYDPFIQKFATIRPLTINSLNRRNLDESIGLMNDRYKRLTKM